MGRWALALLKNTPESVDDPSPESPETRQQIITLLNLAHSYGWGGDRGWQVGAAGP